MRPSHPKVLLVLWEDHHMGRTSEPRPLLVYTVGFLVYEDDKVIQLAHNYEELGAAADQEDRYDDNETITLIKKCHIKRRTLAPAFKGD